MALVVSVIRAQREHSQLNLLPARCLGFGHAGTHARGIGEIMSNHSTKKMDQLQRLLESKQRCGLSREDAGRASEVLRKFRHAL